MKIYHTETQADYDALMVELEEQGAKWPTGTNPTEANNWPEFECQTGIKVQDCRLTYHGVEYYERVNHETPIIKYTAKKETRLPEWAKWLARDKDGGLWAYSAKPLKADDFWHFKNSEDKWIGIEETDDTFSHIKWTDEEPTKIKRGLEAGGVSVAELNRIMNAKAHGYDEVPTMEKSKVYHGKTIPENANENDILFEKGTIDGKQVTIMNLHNGTTFEPIGSADKPTTMDNPEIETDTNKDMVNQPNHYIGEYGLEVEDVLRNFIPRYTDPYVGHRIASAIEYLLRSPLKNQRQDIEKAGKNIQQALAYLDMMDELK